MEVEEDEDDEETGGGGGGGVDSWITDGCVPVYVCV